MSHGIVIRQDTVNGSQFFYVVAPWPQTSKIDKHVIESRPPWLTVLPNGNVLFSFINGKALYLATSVFHDYLEYWEIELIDSEYQPIEQAA